MPLPRLIAPVRSIFPRYPISASYLFGSQVTGRTTPASDYDFAVLFSSKVLPSLYSHYKLQLTIELLQVIHTEFVDLVILNDVRTPLLLKFNIIKHGRVIYEKSKKARQELECDVLLRWFDQQYFENLWYTIFTKNLAQGKIL